MLGSKKKVDLNGRGVDPFFGWGGGGGQNFKNFGALKVAISNFAREARR